VLDGAAGTGLTGAELSRAGCRAGAAGRGGAATPAAMGAEAVPEEGTAFI
jgi:hypothetical protein